MVHHAWLSAPASHDLQVFHQLICVWMAVLQGPSSATRPKHASGQAAPSPALLLHTRTRQRHGRRCNVQLSALGPSQQQPVHLQSGSLFARPGQVGVCTNRGCTNTSMVSVFIFMCPGIAATGQATHSERCSLVYTCAHVLTAQVHGSVGLSMEPAQGLEEEAEDVVTQLWQDLGNADGWAAPDAQVLSQTLPCFPAALLGRATDDVALSRAAALLNRLTISGLAHQEAQAMGLMSGVLARGADAEPEERQLRNALVRQLMEGFAAARVSGRIEKTGSTSQMAAAVLRYRQRYRQRTLDALRAAHLAAQAGGEQLAMRAVLLRQQLRGNLSATLLRYPGLMRVELGTLQQLCDAAATPGGMESSQV